MARVAADYDEVEVRSVAELRAWLEAHHRRDQGVWLFRYKTHCGERHVSHGAMVDELLCVGWVDGLVRRVDEDRLMQLISPRKAGSTWSRVNKDKVAALRKSGRMRPAGEAVIARAIEDGSWTFLDDVEALVVPDDLDAALSKKARRAWDGFPDSSKKGILAWIKLARTAPTRARRIAKAAAMAEVGLRAQHPEDEKAWKSRPQDG